MKILIVVRHAKSSWEAGILNDYDRVLNARGHEEAKTVAQQLKDKKITPQLLISSTATRAFTTATYFANTFEIAIADIEKQSNLYNAPAQHYFNVLNNVNNDFDCAAVFGHNSGITDFVNSLLVKQIVEMPTAGVFVLEADCKHWNDFEKSKKKFLFFLQP